MIHCGVFPWAQTAEGPVFLMGRERFGKWSSFGGRPKAEETIIETAVREAWEESMGFLGSKSEIEAGLDTCIYHESENSKVFTFEVKYNPDLPRLFLNNFECTREMTRSYVIFYNRKTKANSRTIQTGGKSKTYHLPLDAADGFFEKTEIQWFTADQIRASIRQIRASNLATTLDLVRKISARFKQSCDEDGVSVDWLGEKLAIASINVSPAEIPLVELV